MAEYNNNTDSVVFWYVNKNTYGHLVKGQVLSTNSEFQIIESHEDFNTLIGETYEYELPSEIEKEINPIDYNSEVERLIAQRYTLAQELAILRQQFIKPDEYQEYFDYCEACKLQVKEMIENHS